jgi:ribonuclease BN (tRNA processing enzyme)
MRLELTILHASEDGVAPAFIASLCSDKTYVTPTQYLFNVPEGFSRLALEKRVRPGIGLKSVFTTGTNPKTIGGLGGLMLRLKSDGHGEVHLMGPKGLGRVLRGLREGIEVNWTTPQVNLKELSPAKAGDEGGGPTLDYEDAEVEVEALHLQLHWTLPSFLSDLKPPSTDPPREPASSRKSNGEEKNGSQTLPSGIKGLFLQLDELLSHKATVKQPVVRGREGNWDLGGNRGLGGKGDSGSLLKSKVLELLGKGKESRDHEEGTSAKRSRVQEDEIQEQLPEALVDPSSSTSLAGYLVHVRSTRQVLAVISCSHLMLLDPLSRHPLFTKNAPGSLHRMHESHRLMCTLHLTPPNIANHKRYQDWIKRLPGHHAYASAQPPTLNAPTRSLGFIASARVSAKLNRVSSVLFPLPKTLCITSNITKNEEKLPPEAPSDEIPPTSNLPKLLALDLMSVIKIKLISGTPLALEVFHASTEWNGCGESEREYLSTSLSQLYQQVPELNLPSVLSSPSLQNNVNKRESLKAGPSFASSADPPLPPPGWLVSIATFVLDLQQGLGPRADGKSRQQSTLPAPSLVDNRQVAAEMRKKLKVTPENHPVLHQQTSRSESINQVYPTVSTLSTSTLKTFAQLDEEPVPPCLLSLEAAQTSILFLGTGSAEPSRHRGPSAILLSQPGGGLLMDVGEGTFGQLRRLHGEEGATKILQDLKLIWISHKHADHTLGLVHILNARLLGSTGRDRHPLVVVGSAAVEKWLTIHYEHEESHPAWIFIHCSKFNSSLLNQEAALSPVVSCLGLTQWKSVPVHHCKDAYALVIKSLGGWKIVYSGDCRPSVKLQEEGMDATLLIHESTFDPSLSEMALQKRHSTSNEALEVARGMRAYRTILTHFSQRYPKIPDGLEGSSDSFKAWRETPMVAFDGLSVPLSLLPVLPLLLPAMSIALKEDDKNEEV